MTATKDQTIAGKVYWKDGPKYYIEYELINKPESQGGDQNHGLMRIARDRMGSDKQYKEILKLKNGQVEAFSPPYTVDFTMKLLLPSAPPAPPVSGSFALTSERNVRSAHVKDNKNIIYTPKADPATKFKYSSLFTDPGGLVWAEVDLTAPNNKDQTGKVSTKGWICVKSGADYYTDPKIDMPEPDKG